MFGWIWEMILREVYFLKKFWVHNSCFKHWIKIYSGLKKQRGKEDSVQDLYFWQGHEQPEGDQQACKMMTKKQSIIIIIIYTQSECLHMLVGK